MRRRKHLDRRDYKIAQPGRARPTKGFRRVLFVVLLLGGGWFVLKYLLSLPSEKPTVTRYEVLSIQP